MEEIVSSRSLKFYLITIFRPIMFWLLGSIPFALRRQATSPIGEVMMILMGLVVILFGFYTIYGYFKNVPLIKIDKASIKIYATSYQWNDLEDVCFNGKRNFKYFWERKEGTLLKFINKNDIVIFDDMYTNSAAIKRFIKHYIIDKATGLPFEIVPATPEDIESESLVYYKNLPIFNHRGVILWGFMLLPVFLSLTKQSIAGSFFLGIGCLLLFLIFSQQFYYFGVSENYLVIRNHNFFWRKKIYRLGDISEVVFEYPRSKMPYPLRVKTFDMQSDVYQAATLWPKSWKALKKTLKEKNVKVQDEAHYF